MKKLISYLSIVLLGTGAVLYPGWILDGYLYEWYPRVGAFIAIYGGLIANIIHLIKIRKK